MPQLLFFFLAATKGPELTGWKPLPPQWGFEFIIRKGPRIRRDTQFHISEESTAKAVCSVKTICPLAIQLCQSTPTWFWRRAALSDICFYINVVFGLRRMTKHAQLSESNFWHFFLAYESLNVADNRCIRAVVKVSLVCQNKSAVL